VRRYASSDRLTRFRLLAERSLYNENGSERGDIPDNEEKAMGESLQAADIISAGDAY